MLAEGKLQIFVANRPCKERAKECSVNRKMMKDRTLKHQKKGKNNEKSKYTGKHNTFCFS